MTCNNKIISKNIQKKPSMIKIDTIGICCALFGAILFSLKPILIKLMYAENIEIEIIMTWRMIISVPFYIFIGLAIYHKHRNNLNLTPLLFLQICIIGIIGYYLATLLDLLGMQYITAQLERIILFTYPTFVTIMSYVFYKEKISFKQFLAMIIAYIGIAIIFNNELTIFNKNTLLGSAYILGAAISFACYILFQKTPIKKIGSRLFTSIAMCAASIIIFIHISFSTGLLFLDISNYGLFLCFITAIICTVIPSYLLTEAVSRIGSGPTSISIGIGPVFTNIFAVLSLGEIFSIYHLIGTILVIIGIYILSQIKINNYI